MRRWSLALLVSFASHALAQAPAAPTAAPEAQAPATPAPTAPAPTPSAPAPTPAAPAPTPAAPAPTPAAPTPKPTAPAPTPAAPTSPASPTTPQPGKPLVTPESFPDPRSVPELPRDEQIRRDILGEARFLFQSLITGDVRSVSNELFYPFQLEDKRYATAEELVAAWVKQLRAKRTDLVTLYDIEVLPLAEMEKKYGKAPARLGMDLRNEKDLWAAVGNLSGRPGVFLFRPYRDEFRAFAYTD